MRKRIINQRGSALLITLLLMMMLTVVGLMAIDTSTNDIELSYYKVHTDKAFYIAEAGMKRAVAEIINDKTWNAGYSAVGFGGGTYTVQVIDSSTNASLVDTVMVTSTGAAIDAVAMLEVLLVPDENHPFRNAMFGKNSIDIRNSFNVDSYNSDSGSYIGTKIDSSGDVGSNGAININNGAFIGGSVATSTTGGLSINPGATVTGTTSDAAPEQTVDPVAQSDFDAAAATNDNLTGISGTYSYDPATEALIATGNFVLTEGTYYFSSIILKNSASLIIPVGEDVTIYVTGDIEMKNSSEMNSGGVPSSLMIYSQGDFVLKNSGDIAAVFYNPNGTADLRNSGEFYGAIVANDIICHNSAKFHYDRNLGDITMGGGGTMAMVAWREL